MSPKKGRIFVETSKGVFPYEILKKAEETSSKQLEETDKWMSQNDLIRPPHPPNSFLAFYESNSIFWRCVNQLASDVAGLGWTIQQREEKKENKVELERINTFLNSPNPEDSFRNILKQLLIDWGAIGWFGLEVARNNKGTVGQVYHVPGRTIKVHKSKTKYCQIRSNKKAWFKKFGDNKNISVKTGNEIATRGGDSANELIFYKSYYPLSDFYGAPNILSAIGDVIGLIGLRDYNLAFFENYGVPAALIVLEGEWEEGSDKKVSDFLNKEIKGSSNAHRTLVVNQPDKCKFTYQKLGVDVKEQSFKLYEKTRQEDILIAYSMPPERLGIRVVGKLGGNVAEEATKVYIESVVEPLQKDLEEIINEKLLQSEDYEFKFKDIDLRNHDALIERVVKQVSSGLLTPNEGRNKLGLPPYPEGDQFYIQSSLISTGETEPKEG